MSEAQPAGPSPGNPAGDASPGDASSGDASPGNPAGNASSGDASPGSDAPPIVLEGFALLVGERPLLEEVNVCFPAGQISLIVGPSGSGKSLLLNVLAGLPLPPLVETRGQLAVGPHDITRNPGAADVGIVFQSFALFDELNAVNNVRFGADHRRPTKRVDPSRSDPRQVFRLLRELGVPADGQVSHLSGGQKQRLALARTLAYDPEVIVYDEPTSGLDPANARRVAKRIRLSQETHGKTTLVVTHDYVHLAPIAGAVFYLDPGERQLVEIDTADLEMTVGQRLEAATEPAPSTDSPDEREKPVSPGVLARCLSTLGDVFESSTRALEASLVALSCVLPLWRSVRWGLRYLRHYITLLGSPSAFAYFGAAGVIAGLVSTHFTFKFLPFKAYTEPLITEELLHGLGFSLYRIIVPVLLTILLAARGGAAIAADVASRTYSRQIDALRSFRVSPRAYLLTNILYATVVATPVLVLFGFYVARITSLVVFTYNYPQHSALFWESHFHRNLLVPGSLLYMGTGWVLLKVLACGLGVGTIAYFQGLRPKSSAVDVSRAITRTIIWATLHVLVMHFLFAFIEFDS